MRIGESFPESANEQSLSPVRRERGKFPKPALINHKLRGETRREAGRDKTGERSHKLPLQQVAADGL